MDFYEVLAKVIEILQREGRTSYRALKRQFDLDDEFLEDLKLELIEVRECAVGRDKKMLVWTGDTESASSPAPSMHQGEESQSRFHVVLPAIIAFLQCEERVTYRTLKDIFGLSDRLLTNIREELHLRQLAIDEGGKVLVWTGKAQSNITPAASEPSQQVSHDIEDVILPVDSSLSYAASETGTQAHGLTAKPELTRSTPEAENRQLTVVFCDLADSTKLSQQLDPEDLREVVRAYQETSAAVIDRYEGHIAQYLGDGLLIYFGWPQAHENDAERAVYTALEIPNAIDKLNTRLATEYGVQLAVRIGIHTGPVVVGEMGGGDRHENLALGETPNIAARLEGLAPPNTAVISPATAQLVQRTFILEEIGLHELKGVAEPMMLYTVVGSRETGHDDHEDMLSGGFDALVGRDEEIGLLLKRWEQSKDGQGQVVLISGEAGLGKSSLVEGLRSHVHKEGYTRIAFRCSPYTTNSALYPVIEHVQRALGWQRDDSAETRLDKLEQALKPTSLPIEEAVPLVATLLSLSVPEDRYPALTVSPQRQRQLTQDALVAWMLEETEHQPVLAVWEDLHWADPSTLELLGLFIEQIPTVPMLNVLAYRPEFVPPWQTQSHMTPITLNRLERTHIEALVRRLAGGKMLPQEVVAHVVTKTDGVPLYVEELTKMLLESDLLEEKAEHYVLTGELSSAAIPASLQSALLARLDRLPEIREVAQLGAVVGREFDYAMIQGLSALDEPRLQNGLKQLVETGLLYQRGRIPRSRYIFRHILFRDVAYESLLRRTRQQVHQQVAQLFEARFPEMVKTHPELVAYHYTEANSPEQGMNYWQQAGQQAARRSANQEAIQHLTKGLELLATQPDTPERAQQELELLATLAPVLRNTRGQAAPEVGEAYTRAYTLCQQIVDAPQRFLVLRGLWNYYNNRAELQTAYELAKQFFELVQGQDDVALLLWGHCLLGMSEQYYRGSFASARDHYAQALALYDDLQHRSLAFEYGQDPRVLALSFVGWTSWLLGYPDQSVEKLYDALALAQELAHPYSLAAVLNWVALFHQFRREGQAVYQQANAVMAVASEYGFTQRLAWGRLLRGWALAKSDQASEGLEQIRQGLADFRATGQEIWQPYNLALLGEAYEEDGNVEDGLRVIEEALALVESTGECFWEVELYRLQGHLLLKQVAPDEYQAEGCFHKALEVSRNQQAKSLELRAATSLARLWQSQGKRDEARELLSEIYGWFTEGFDTADLIDAKALLVELEEGSL